MKIVKLTENSTNNTENRSVLILGNFDGVHIGHKALVNCAKSIAKRMHCAVGVYTFEINTKRYFSHDDFFCLSTDDEKNDIFKSLNVDFVAYDDFLLVKDFTPEDFVAYLSENFNLCAVVCGENFRFGKNAGAGSKELKKLMTRNGIECESVPLEYVDGECVSSTAIRHYIACGNIEKANQMLGYRYFIKAEVIHGAKLGRTLGFPTVNQYVYGCKAVPEFGVYACVCDIDGTSFMAVTNVGVKPTVTYDKENPPIVFESHILDYSGDVYGKVLTVHFLKKLRGEKKFATLEELKENVLADAHYTRKLFDNGGLTINIGEGRH